MLKSNRSENGTSLLEVMVAMGILAFAFSSLYALYGQSLRSVLATSNANVAQAFLMEQGDLLRDSNWGLLGGAPDVVFPNTILPSPAENPNLGRLNGTNLSQRLSAYPLLPSRSGITSIASSTPTPTPTPAPIYSITRAGSGARSAYSIPASAATLEGMTFVLQLQWTEKGRRVSKEHTLLISKKAVK